MNNNTPFFIVGSPRSGTTILRDVMRLNNNLESPEETFFYRWSEPFGSDFYNNTYSNNKTIIKHREIDGISEEEFMKIYQTSNSRKELQNNYMSLFLEKKDKQNCRWFDKTPQNVFGIDLLSCDYPKAKIIHIHRHPLNVTASLTMGRMLKEHSIIGAINTWKESVKIAIEFGKSNPDKLLHVKYETFVKFPFKQVNRIGDFIGEDLSDIIIPKDFINFSSTKRYQEIFDEKDISFIQDNCRAEMDQLKYEELP